MVEDTDGVGDQLKDKKADDMRLVLFFHVC